MEDERAKIRAFKFFVEKSLPWSVSSIFPCNVFSLQLPMLDILFFWSGRNMISLFHSILHWVASLGLIVICFHRQKLAVKVYKQSKLNELSPLTYSWVVSLWGNGSIISANLLQDLATLCKNEKKILQTKKGGLFLHSSITWEIIWFSEAWRTKQKQQPALLSSIFKIVIHKWQVDHLYSVSNWRNHCKNIQYWDRWMSWKISIV